jgi:hypothetical protein
MGYGLSHPVFKTGEGLSGRLNRQELAVGLLDMIADNSAEFLPHFSDA